MIQRLTARLARMDADEIAWRGKAAARTLLHQTSARLSAPRWNRTHLAAALAAPAHADDDLRAAYAALRRGAWLEAHAALARHFSAAPQRFVIHPRIRQDIAASIRGAFPDATRDAVNRADRIVAGEYDLLGYHALRFESAPPALPALPAPPAVTAPDWQLDPVNGRRPPRLFWSTVPYLAAESGDHKIIWELNRHQHWLALGRASWLAGDARYRGRFINELESWIRDNPPLTGVNWASMLELAFRSISWIWAIQFFAADAGDDAEPWLVDLLLALDRQLTHVEENLSYYFSPNTHLLGEALALYVAGNALPALAASARRVSTGRAILIAEIDRQIAGDGGHCERSTHYHRYTLDFYSLALVIARLAGDAPAAARFEDAVSRLGTAARLLADENGVVPHIGDDDGGALLPIAGRRVDDLRDSLAIAASLVRRPELQIGTAPEESVWMLGGADPQSTIDSQSAIDNRSAIRNPQSAMSSAALPDTGYYVSRSSAGGHLVIDGGAHGYQNGGHAHADALSLTLSLRGVPLLIDPGTGCYTTDPVLRDRLRSTALHNTVTLDDRPQSVPRGPFHWSSVANGRVNLWRTHQRFDFFDGAHDGYGPVEHRRRVFVLHGDLVVVADLADGPGAHHAGVHWHLDPGWAVDLHGRRAVLTRVDRTLPPVGFAVPQGLVESLSADDESGLGWHSPVYGRLEPATTLRVTHEGAAPFWMVSVFDLDPANPVADVDYVPVWAEAGAYAHAAAIRITRAMSVDHVLFAEPAAAQASCRVGEVETDARLLFYRTTAAQPIALAALVDGSIVRASGRREFQLALPRREASYFFDSGTKDQSICAASPVS